MDTMSQFDGAIAQCHDIFTAKLNDYGASWRIMRPCSVTDQIFIKAKRIRSIETKGCTSVGEGILPEFKAIVNYAVIGIIQLRQGYSDTIDMSADEAVKLYDDITAEARRLLEIKNHDYDEAWRSMRVSSYTDFILTKIERVKEIEDNGGAVKVSEGIDSNYFDILVYAIFGIIKLTECPDE